MISNLKYKYSKLELENKCLRILLKWAIECDFGFDNFIGDEDFDLNKFFEEVENMDYEDQMIEYVKRILK